MKTFWNRLKPAHILGLMAWVTFFGSLWLLMFGSDWSDIWMPLVMSFLVGTLSAIASQMTGA